MIPLALFAAVLALIAAAVHAAPSAAAHRRDLLLAGLLLAFAAQTAGLGPDQPAAPSYFDSRLVPAARWGRR